MGCFVNFSNHPSIRWTDEQVEAAMVCGDIVDVPFPLLEANISEEEMIKIGDECVKKIVENNPTKVMCQGEFTLTFYVVNKLIKKGITCVAACTKRVSNEMILDDGSVRKESYFVFEGFRKYF